MRATGTPPACPGLRRFASPLLAGLLLVSSFVPAHAAVTGAEREARIEAVKRIQLDHLRKGARARLARAKDNARLIKKGKAPKGAAHKPAPPEVETPELRAKPEVASPFGVSAVNVIPTNVKANTTVGDGANATQSEESIVSWGDYVMVAWNDGQGSFTGGAYQGYAYSVDGGQTFVDGGDPPNHPSYPTWRWSSDPVLTVNEKTGEFYYCGLADASSTQNAIGVARGHFSGSSFVWDGVAVVRVANNTTAFLDKQWIAADSVSGNLYVTNTTFTASNQIDFYRSTDGGVTWSAPTKLSSTGDNGRVQGSRVVTGPAGEVHTVWSAIGTSFEDFMRYRKSTNFGSTFAAQVNSNDFLSNFGTGGPGFNRERGIHFPSIAVDRTFGVNRGRVYVTWNESFNQQDDNLGYGLARVEVEGNNTPATATTFTPGDILRGTTSSVSPTDFDYWKVALAAGQGITVWADSMVASQTYTLRLLAPTPDDAQRLAFAGDVTPDANVQQAFYTFVAPVAGTYYLRFAPAYTSASSKVGGYHIYTGAAVRATERGRDQRDVFVTWSDNGTTWATPVRVNDDAVGFDDWLPEVTVGADGFPYIHWFDFRDDTYGSRSHRYLARSTNGGTTWTTNQRISSAQTNWTTVLSNLAPNQGDYNHAWSNERWVNAVWADGRDGTPDAWTTRVDTWPGLGACPSNAATQADSNVPVTWNVVNNHPLFANDYTVAVTNERGWPMPSNAALSIASLGNADANFNIAVPDTAALGDNDVTLTLTSASGSLVRTCTFTITVEGQLAVGDGASAFALAHPTPQPARGNARLSFTLPREAQARLVVYGLSGQRVRTLVDGMQAAGRTDVTWDGRDEHGRPVEAGAYFVKLESEGRSASRRLVWMR